jgi:hypothetical protein
MSKTKSLKKQVYVQVRLKVFNHVWYKMVRVKDFHRVCGQVEMQVWRHRVWRQLYDQVWGEFLAQVIDKTRNEDHE